MATKLLQVPNFHTYILGTVFKGNSAVAKGRFHHFSLLYYILVLKFLTWLEKLAPQISNLVKLWPVRIVKFTYKIESHLQHLHFFFVFSTNLMFQKYSVIYFIPLDRGITTTLLHEWNNVIPASLKFSPSGDSLKLSNKFTEKSAIRISLIYGNSSTAKGQCHEFYSLNFITLNKWRHLKIQFILFYIGFQSML